MYQVKRACVCLHMYRHRIKCVTLLYLQASNNPAELPLDFFPGFSCVVRKSLLNE